MDIKGVNYLKCDRKNCFYNVGNECQCVQVCLTKDGICDRIEAPQRKRYKIKGYKNKFFKPMVNINLSGEELNEIAKKLIQELQRKPVTIMPKHIEDNIYYMSGGTE